MIVVISTIIVGILLILLGLGGYFGTGSQSVTALIPSFFGIIILILGILAKNEKWRKHLMHSSLILAFLGLLGSFSGLPKIFVIIGGGDVVRPAAVISQTIMALICIIYLLIGIKSFIVARRKPVN